MTNTGHNESELFARARQGDAEAFAQLFEQYRPTLCRVVYRLVGADDCEDVVMESYLKAWRAIPGFRGRSALSTWLCRIARNCAIDWQRQSTRRERHHVHEYESEEDEAPLIERTPDEQQPTPERQAHLNDLGQILQEGLAQLSDEHRTALVLREIDGLSYCNVAAATGVSIGTVMSRLFYARRRLRRIVEEKLA